MRTRAFRGGSGEPRDLDVPGVLPSATRRLQIRAAHAPRRPAFTLIELILAVAVMSIVLISINAVFFAALRLHDATNAAVNESLPIQQALTTMRRDLQGVMPPTTNGIISGDFKVGAVQSTGLGLPVDIEISTTTGVMRDTEPWGDVQRVTYELKPPMDVTQPGRDLYRSVTRNVLATAPPQPDDQWLLSNVQSVEYACFDGTSWENYWDSTVTTNLPLAIRVRIYMASGPNAGSPLEMVVPLDQQSPTNTAPATGTTTTGA